MEQFQLPIVVADTKFDRIAGHFPKNGFELEFELIVDFQIHIGFIPSKLKNRSTFMRRNSYNASSVIEDREIKRVRCIVRDLSAPLSFSCGIADCKKTESSAWNQPVYGHI